MSRINTQSPENRSRAAHKGWARRHLNDYLSAVKYYLGHTPDKVTVWAEDFDLLGGQDDRITLIKGHAKPVPAAQRESIH